MDAGTNLSTAGRTRSRPRMIKMRASRSVAKPLKFILAVIFALTPVTAIILLGWLARLSERKSLKYFLYNYADNRGVDHDPGAGARRIAAKWPSWFFYDEPFEDISPKTAIDRTSPGKSRSNLFSRYLGGLWANITTGLKSLISLAILTIPFGALWLLGWWSGWQNSFTKGYEQAYAGPVISLIGIVFALLALSYLPMALAHFSLERRISAFFEIRKVTKLIHRAGWRYLALGLGYVIASLPIFFATVAPVFIEQIKPEILAMTPAEITELAGSVQFWTTIYIVAALIFLRTMAARIYARSLLGLPDQERQNFAATRLMSYAIELEFQSRKTKKSRFGKIRTLLMSIFLALIWFGLVAQIYIGQFMNYKWWSWLSHPLIQIPWFPPLGPWG